MLDPSLAVQPGAVYSLPPDGAAGGGGEDDDRVMRRALRLGLPGEQEHMRMAIARSLVRPRSPRVRRNKAGILSRMLRRL